MKDLFYNLLWVVIWTLILLGLLSMISPIAHWYDSQDFMNDYERLSQDCYEEWTYFIANKYMLIQQYCNYSEENYVMTMKKSLFIDIENMQMQRFNWFLIK